MPIWLRKFTHNKLMEHYKLLKGDDKELTSQTDFSKLPQLPKVNDPRNIKSKPK